MTVPESPLLGQPVGLQGDASSCMLQPLASQVGSFELAAHGPSLSCPLPTARTLEAVSYRQTHLNHCLQSSMTAS